MNLDELRTIDKEMKRVESSGWMLGGKVLFRAPEFIYRQQRCTLPCCAPLSSVLAQWNEITVEFK